MCRARSRGRFLDGVFVEAKQGDRAMQIYLMDSVGMKKEAAVLRFSDKNVCEDIFSTVL